MYIPLWLCANLSVIHAEELYMVHVNIYIAFAALIQSIISPGPYIYVKQAYKHGGGSIHKDFIHSYIYYLISLTSTEVI